jgi:CheY-like chemotaxis protein
MKATLLPPAFSCTKRRPSWRDQVLSKSKIAVLVVEDIPQIRAIAIQLFEELGCRVFDAYNGQQALKLLQAHPDIQVLFADVRMPGMSGTELAAAAQHLRPALRIVLRIRGELTAAVSRSAMEAVGSYGTRLISP